MVRALVAELLDYNITYLQNKLSEQLTMERKHQHTATGDFILFFSLANRVSAAESRICVNNVGANSLHPGTDYDLINSGVIAASPGSFSTPLTVFISSLIISQKMPRPCDCCIHLRSFFLPSPFIEIASRIVNSF